MKTFRTPLIAVAVLTMTPCATFSQVRIITPDSEHLYSTDPRTPGRQLPDNEALRLQNERAEKARIAREREKADQAASSKSQSPKNTDRPPKSGWVYQLPPNYQPTDR
jgi:hypothetical protein